MVQNTQEAYPFIFTRRYDTLRGPTYVSCGGHQPLAMAFMALGPKKGFVVMCWPFLGFFWCSTVFLVAFITNPNN